MDHSTAQEITNLVCQNPMRGMMDAIRLLRMETAMGLIDAKNYLEEAKWHGDEAMLKQLCTDFVQNKEDLLNRALNDRRILDLYIEQLQKEIEFEKEEVSEMRPVV